MSMSRHLPPVLLFAVLSGTAAGAWARPPARAPQAPPPGSAQAAERHRGDDALSDSVRRIERSTRGQVLSAERVPFDGRNVNRIKIVDDRGRVRVYMDDPQAQAPRQPPTHRDDD